MKRNFNRLLVLFVVLATGLAGCNLPRADEPAEPDVTQAYQTVSARLTEAAILTPPVTSTSAPTATLAATTPTSQVTAATPTVKATSAPTSPAKLCDQAAPGVPIDVTIPDDTKMQPGEDFIKIAVKHTLLMGVLAIPQDLRRLKISCYSRIIM